MNNKGATLIELAATAAILGVVTLGFTYVTKSFMISIFNSDSMSKSVTASHSIFAYLERDLYNANEILVAGGNNITVIQDITKRPGYNLLGDHDVDTIINQDDPDIDNDLSGKNAADPGDKWKFGYNLADDDDDGNDLLDFRVRYRVQNDILYRETSSNMGAWTTPQKIATGVKTFALNYYGSKENTFGSKLDNGQDGMPNTGDLGEGDGIISAREMDYTLPAQGGDGDRSGALDTTLERQYITSIRINIEISNSKTLASNPNDPNNQSFKTTFSLATEIYPPLLPIKTLQK